MEISTKDFMYDQLHQIKQLEMDLQKKNELIKKLEENQNLMKLRQEQSDRSPKSHQVTYTAKNTSVSTMPEIGDSYAYSGPEFDMPFKESPKLFPKSRNKILSGRKKSFKFSNEISKLNTRKKFSLTSITRRKDCRHLIITFYR